LKFNFPKKYVKVINSILLKFKSRPDILGILLFGSLSRDDYNNHSDIDIMIISKLNTKKINKNYINEFEYDINFYFSKLNKINKNDVSSIYYFLNFIFILLISNYYKIYGLWEPKKINRLKYINKSNPKLFVNCEYFLDEINILKKIKLLKNIKEIFFNGVKHI